MKTVLVTGKLGQLGTELQRLSAFIDNYHFVFTGKEELDITDFDLVERFFDLHRVDFCINTAAYTAVDDAEKEHERAFQINSDAVANLAQVCKRHNTLLFHFSTDFVFDGKATTPYQEEEPAGPVNLYGQSKWQGEEKLREAGTDHIIIRTSWVYSPYGKNFVKTILRLAKEREHLKVVDDQWGRPTYAADLAAATLKILRHDDLRNRLGTYHYANKGIISWYDFAQAIVNESHMNCDITPIATTGYPTPARRPAYSALDTQKISKIFSVEIPEWRLSLKRCLAILGQNS